MTVYTPTTEWVRIMVGYAATQAVDRRLPPEDARDEAYEMFDRWLAGPVAGVVSPAAAQTWDRVHNRPADIYTPPEDRVAPPTRNEREALIARFDMLRNSGVCSPTTRGLLDDAEALLRRQGSTDPKCEHGIALSDLCAYADHMTNDETAPPADDEPVESMARIIWETSQADEGTITATGANIVARALAATGFGRQGPITDAQKHADELLAYIDYCLGLPMYQNAISEFGQGVVEMLRMVRRTFAEGLHPDARTAAEAARDAS